MMTSEQFWKMADGARTTEQYNADKKLHYLRTAPLDVLHKIFVQYRFFTLYYISDLAYLVYKTPFGRLRSTLADILNEELGEGDENKAHPAVYDSFLRSIGVSEEELENPHPANVALLDEMRQHLVAGSFPYALGLRGMGGECLCQIHLEVMFDHFKHNPNVLALEKNGTKIDWLFWDIHAGEVDQHHRVLMRECLTEVMEKNPEIVDELAAGYWRAKRNFDAFWDNIFSESAEGSGEIVTTDEELAVFGAISDVVSDSGTHLMYPPQYRDTPNFFSIYLNRPEHWFMRAFLDAERKWLTTRMSVDMTQLLAPGFEVDSAPVVFGQSRVYIQGVADIPKLRALVLHAYEEQAKHAS